MCGSPKKIVKKIFGIGSSGGRTTVVQQAPAATPVQAPSAVNVDAPQSDVETGLSSERERRHTRAKGKRRLTISTRNMGGGGGTGVNI